MLLLSSDVSGPVPRFLLMLYHLGQGGTHTRTQMRLVSLLVALHAEPVLGVSRVCAFHGHVLEQGVSNWHNKATIGRGPSEWPWLSG